MAPKKKVVAPVPTSLNLGEATHPSKSDAPRFPYDKLLREHGFRIWRRPNGRSAVWRWERPQGDGAEYPEEKALLKLPADALADAAMLADIDCTGM
jgi:hypothetical protein